MENTFSIPTENVSAIQARIAEANKKANKLGVPPLVLTIGETSIQGTEPNGCEIRRTEVTLTGETPKLSGWSFLASLELTDNGSLIRSLPGVECPADQRDRGNECDHCHNSRNRVHTYVLRHDDGRVVTVGRQCLQDFMGSRRYSTEVIARWFLFVGELIAEVSDPGFGSNIPRTYAMATILQVTVAITSKYGWVSRRMVQDGAHDGPTTAQYARFILDHKTRNEKEIAEKGEILGLVPGHRKEAYDAIAWILAQDPKSDYTHTCQVLAKNNWVETKDFGFACSILTSYRTAMGREIERAAMRKRLADSEYVGIVGKRQVMRLSVSDIRELPSDFGVTCLHIMTDEEGNSLKWFASGKSLGTGTHTVKATVKAHKEYNGIKETIVTRVAEVA
jgi:hypothetical protein